jgi:hypothetical protein
MYRKVNHEPLIPDSQTEMQTVLNPESETLNPK